MAKNEIAYLFQHLHPIRMSGDVTFQVIIVPELLCTVLVGTGQHTRLFVTSYMLNKCRAVGELLETGGTSVETAQMCFSMMSL